VVLSNVSNQIKHLLRAVGHLAGFTVCRHNARYLGRVCPYVTKIVCRGY
jgi:hypothetical protein